MNLVSTIMQLLGPTILNRIASSLGLNQGIVGQAVAAAVPAILAGLAGKASQPGGATQLSNVIARQDPSILGNLGSLIGGHGESSLIEQGTNALSSLLGGSATSGLAGALGKFAGLSGGQSSSLIGMLAPVVLGQLGKVQSSSGLDAGGLAKLLESQKSEIASALPSGFSNLLSGTGLLDGLGERARAAAAPVPDAISDAGSSLGKWLWPLIIAGLALFLISTYGCQQKTVQTTAPATPPAATEPAPAPGPDFADVTKKALDQLTTALGGVTDAASAQAAVPHLQDIAKQVADVKTGTGAVPADLKKQIASLIAAALPNITAAIDKARAIPGIAAIIDPVVGPIIANLQELAKD